MDFREKPRRKSNMKKWLIIGFTLAAILLVAGVVFIRKTYSDNLQAVSSEQKSQVVTVEPGSTTGMIADTLHSKGLIRSDWAFEWYVRNHDLRDKIQAGTYVLYQNQSVEEIVNILIEGKVAADLVTIIPGQRIDQIKDTLVKAGFNENEVVAALDPKLWADHPALTDKPVDASLEGYIYPESFQKIAETTPNDVIKLALDEMEAKLTPELRQAVSKQGMTLHQAITLASVIEREVTSPEDRAQVAQVFNKRIKDGMRLESNATDDYAAMDPTYNTYEILGLPPGPISNFSESALEAVAYPAQTDWTYFVSGDDGRTHFSKTLQEHEDLTKKYCTKACGY